jgi:hypothetical protein
MAVIVVRGGEQFRLYTETKRLIEDEFVSELLRKGYNVASRSDVEAILKESRFQRSGLTDQDAAQVGRILNVPAVLIVSVTHLDRDQRWSGNLDVSSTLAAMGVRLISVERGEVLWVGKQRAHSRGATERIATLLVVSLARQIALAFPPKSP